MSAGAEGGAQDAEASEPRSAEPPKTPSIRPRSTALPNDSLAKTGKTTGKGGIEEIRDQDRSHDHFFI